MNEASLALKNVELEKKLVTLQKTLEAAVEDCEASHRSIKSLDTEGNIWMKFEN